MNDNKNKETINWNVLLIVNIVALALFALPAFLFTGLGSVGCNNNSACGTAFAINMLAFFVFGVLSVIAPTQLRKNSKSVFWRFFAFLAIPAYILFFISCGVISRMFY